MTNYLIVPGLGNSGPEHWQSYFETCLDDAYRIEQRDWDSPTCADWISAIDQKVGEFEPSTVVLVGHSLGCMAIAHWANQYKRQIRGALLVAPSDPEAPAYTFPTCGFTPVPLKKIAFTTVVVSSSNDQWVSMERAKYFAHRWRSKLVNLGAAGHVNVASGHTRWDEGLRILRTIA